MGIQHPAAAQHVVQNDESPRTNQFHAAIVIGAVVFLIGVYKAEIENAVHQFKRIERGTEFDFDLVTVQAFGKIALGDFRGLRIDLAGHDAPVLRQRLGPGQRAITREHADLEDAPRARDRREHFQELSLDGPDHHARTVGLRISLDPKFVM